MLRAAGWLRSCTQDLYHTLSFELWFSCFLEKFFRVQTVIDNVLFVCLLCAMVKQLLNDLWTSLSPSPVEQDCFTVQVSCSFLGKQDVVFYSWVLNLQRDWGHTGSSWECQTHVCLVQANTRVLFPIQRQITIKASPRAMFRTGCGTLRVCAQPMLSRELFFSVLL